MSATEYVYSILDTIPVNKIDVARLSYEIRNSAITRALEGISIIGDNLKIIFKDSLTVADKLILDGQVNDSTILENSILYTHSGLPLPIADQPVMPDGRPIVRADSRPIGTQTYFSMRGDSATNIGDGEILKWDFSNQINEVETYDSNWRCKHIDLTFLDPLYLKDGAIYFFDAPKDSYCQFVIVCPAGYPYVDNDGIPHIAAEDTSLNFFVGHHEMYTSCPMGDELNAEGSQETPVPPGYYLRGIVWCPSNNSTLYGYAELEMYRLRTVLFEGESP